MAVQNARILVTGGAGFIGSHLVEALLDGGAHSVIALDDLRCGTWRNLTEASKRFGDRLQQVTLDFAAASPEELTQLLNGVDYLYHLAAEKHNQSKDAPGRVLEVNINGTYRLFQAACAAKVRKTVFTSSLYAYGRMNLPAMEETQLPEPHTVYGISKLSGEHLLRQCYLQHGMPGTTVRLFFVYGDRQYAGMGYKSVILTHFERILAGEAPVIFGDGEQALDYVYVDDVTHALMAALSPEADQQVLNIGTGTAVSVNELTALSLEAAGSQLKPIYGPADWTAGSCRVSNPEKAARVIGWRPTISMAEGLARVYRWMQLHCTDEKNPTQVRQHL